MNAATTPQRGLCVLRASTAKVRPPRLQFALKKFTMTSIDEKFEPQTDALAAALAAVGIEVTAEQSEQLDDYRRLLWSWNEKLNLTRHTTLEKFVHRDVFDSWQLANLLQPGERVLDVGTGGGVP